MRFPDRHSGARAAWRVACAALLLALSLPAFAQQYGRIVLWPGGNLYADNNTSADRLGLVPRGERVEVLQNDMLGLWSKVRWVGKEGWISRGSYEKLDAAQAQVAAATPAAPVIAPPPQAAAPAIAPVIAPPAAQAPPVATAAQAGQPAALPPGRGHAVIFGVSHYPESMHANDLPGVPYDMDSANAMAQLMGITPNRIATYRDSEVTKAAIISVLTQLAKDVREGEPVLIYYSGHGTRWEYTPGNCVEGLLPFDGQALRSEEMRELLQPLAQTTDGLFVFFDSCFSGGMSSTRATRSSGLTPKFTELVSRAGEGARSNCSTVANWLSQPPGTRATGNRYVYAGAARNNEFSLDNPKAGGLATSNFLRCMVQGGAGAQTVDGIRACAQKGIDDYLRGNPDFAGQNMTVTGDLNIRPVRADISPTFKTALYDSALQRKLAPPLLSGKSAQVVNALGAQGWPAVDNPQQAFAAIAAHADAGAPLAVETPETMKIGLQPLRMKVTVPADGYLYVFQATGDGKSAVMLFPNMVDPAHAVRAGQVLDLPRASWPLMAGGPAGDNQLLLVFSRSERDIGQLVGDVAGPFLDLAVSPLGMQSLALAVSRPAAAGLAECKGAAAGRPAQCAPAYSASIRTIREVP